MSGTIDRMNIRKYMHACLVLEKDDQSLVIDPGVWSEDFEIPKNTVGIVITHEHADHFDKTKIEEIIVSNPKVCIYAHVSIIEQLGNLTTANQTVSSGDTVTCGPFTLEFTGGEHLYTHPDFPVPPNLGVLVNNGELYYPGDSFALPGRSVRTLAVPASAPWMKISQAMDFIVDVKPKTYFPTHDALLSEKGHELVNSWLVRAADSIEASLETL